MGRRGVHMWDWVVAALGLLLILSLFLTWYSSNKNTQTPTGWQALALVDKIVLLAGLFGMAAPIVARIRQTPKDMQRYLVLVAAWGTFTALVLIYRIASPPQINSILPKVTDVKAGPWVALALTIALVLAAAAAMRSRVATRAATVS